MWNGEIKGIRGVSFHSALKNLGLLFPFVFCLYSICCLKIALKFFSFARITRITLICAQLHIVRA